jgi:hypothetical protein
VTTHLGTDIVCHGKPDLNPGLMIHLFSWGREDLVRKCVMEVDKSGETLIFGNTSNAILVNILSRKTRLK